ncbi:hypothetical protein [Scleromatobacter humisilvae]|nr:hypothetical protein [Scleromatobacter humisilvae]
MSVVLLVTGGLRVVQHGALSLVSPSTLRRAQSQFMRVVTVVAGH